MVTVTVTLRDATYERLKAQAESLGLDVAALLAADAEARLPDEDVSEEFMQIVREQMVRYRRLFERLAE